MASTLERFRDWAGNHYANLAAWKASAEFTASQAFYAPGLEANSKEGNPGIPQATYDAPWGTPDLDYRPASAGIAATGAKDLSSSGFPDGTADGYFGAVDPDAATGLGAVGIPLGTPIGPELTPWTTG